MDCLELFDQLGDYLDREARQDLCRAIEEHLRHCSNCRVVVDKTRKTILLYQADRLLPMPPAVVDRLQQALAGAYSAAPADSGKRGGMGAKD